MFGYFRVLWYKHLAFCERKDQHIVNRERRRREPKNFGDLGNLKFVTIPQKVVLNYQIRQSLSGDSSPKKVS